MKIYTLKAIQFLPISLDEAWAFFSDPNNLQNITPPDMQFRTLSGADRPLFAGQVLTYTITPLLGFKMSWVTEITHVSPGHYFVDEQRFGPYAFWHHKHFFREVPGGVEMEDVVDYALPLGFLGRMIQPYLVQPKLAKIFEFRRAKLLSLFGAFEITQKS